MKYYCVNKPFSQKERWMPNLRQQNSFVSANEKAPSHGAGLTKQIYKQLHVSSRNVLQKCTSNLQVLCQFYK